jgi:hypothetical protein
MKNYEMKTGRKRSPGAPHTQGVQAHPWYEDTSELVSVPVSSCDPARCFIFAYITPQSTRGLYIVFSSCFVLSCFCQGIVLSFKVAMSSSGPSEENPLVDIINPYMRELKMHLKELSLKDGELQIKDVQVSKGEGNLEARMEALEQEVFKYKKMAECEVDIIHRINQELVTKYKKETTELWKDIFSLHETTNQLQAQLYDLQNQNCEYEARFQQMSAAASFRILKTKTSFLDGGALPWKYDDVKDYPPPPKE